MRASPGNPFNEAHGRPLRCVEWIAPAGTDPSALLAAVEAQTGCALVATSPTATVHGFVNTKRLTDGSLYVAAHFYDDDCAVPDCPAGHGAVSIATAPAVDAAALVAVVGEHPTHVLTDDAGGNALLLALGMPATSGAITWLGPEPASPGA